jgi:riboflavin kinase/FMN adenylyltransferase
MHADERNLPMYVVTFDPHPAVVLRPEIAPKMLGTLSDRMERLAACGADAVLVVPFTAQLAAITADQAVTAVLADGLNAQVVVVGADFRFGSGAAGDVEFMRGMGEKHGFVVDSVELQSDGVDRFSSTRIRELLALGDVAGAANLLGRPYTVSGPVIRGEQRGRDLGFPTANLEIPEELAAPLDGVYAGWLVDGADRYPAAISVGDNPTFVGASHRVEAYVLDRSDLDLYGKKVSVEFIAWIRDMLPFTGVEPLIEAMNDDVEVTRRILGV